jgi:hypothetical protein
LPGIVKLNEDVYRIKLSDENKNDILNMLIEKHYKKIRTGMEIL